jgi:hypothetical protein
MESDSEFLLDRALAEEFLLLAAEVVQGLDHQLSELTVGRRFHAHFGASHRLCSYLWSYLEDTHCLRSHGLYGARKVHLLWTLDLLKGDDSEHKLKGRWGADEKTIRKWTTVFIQCLSSLGVVSRLRVSRRSFDSFLSVVSPSFDAVSVSSSFDRSNGRTGSLAPEMVVLM